MFTASVAAALSIAAAVGGGSNQIPAPIRLLLPPQFSLRSVPLPPRHLSAALAPPTTGNPQIPSREPPPSLRLHRRRQRRNSIPAPTAPSPYILATLSSAADKHIANASTANPPSPRRDPGSRAHRLRRDRRHQIHRSSGRWSNSDADPGDLQVGSAVPTPATNQSPDLATCTHSSAEPCPPLCAATQRNLRLPSVPRFTTQAWRSPERIHPEASLPTRDNPSPILRPSWLTPAMGDSTMRPVEEAALQIGDLRPSLRSGSGSDAAGGGEGAVAEKPNVGPGPSLAAQSEGIRHDLEDEVEFMDLQSMIWNHTSVSISRGGGEG